MIAGTEADTRYFSEMAINKAEKPKELFLIKGATHVDLYDKKEYVDPAVDKMNSFFKQYLEKPLHTKAEAWEHKATHDGRALQSYRMMAWVSLTIVSSHVNEA